jgi:hypothetical protein
MKRVTVCTMPQGCNNAFHFECVGYTTNLELDVIHSEQLAYAQLYCQRCQEFESVDHVAASKDFLVSRSKETTELQKFLKETGRHLQKVSMDGLCVFKAVVEYYKNKNANRSSSVTVDLLLTRVLETVVQAFELTKSGNSSADKNKKLENPDSLQHLIAVQRLVPESEIEVLKSMLSLETGFERREMWSSVWASFTIADMVPRIISERQKLNLRVWTLSGGVVQQSDNYNFGKGTDEVCELWHWGEEDEGNEHFDLLIKVDK